MLAEITHWFSLFKSIFPFPCLKMIFRSPMVRLLMCAFAVLIFAAGCDRIDNTPTIQEADEPSYRRARELVKQGRNSEALMEFNKVLAKRGLNNSPETHLDMAILYEQHMRDPLSALYHFQKYRELKPNSPQEAMVRQREEAAKRAFASMLPGRPSLDMLQGAASADYEAAIARLQHENDMLRRALRDTQAAAGVASQTSVTTVVPEPVAGQGALVPQARAQNPSPSPSPVTATAFDAQQQQARPVPSPQQQQPQTQPPAQTARPQPQAQPQQPAVRRHQVRVGDSLYNIARQYYGSPTNAQVEAIVSANRDVLQSRNTPLRAGMELRIP